MIGRAVVLAMLAVAAGGCSGTRDCTLVGCANGVVIDLSGVPVEPGAAVRYTVCIESACRTGRGAVQPAGPGRVLVIDREDVPERDEVAMRVTLTGADGRSVADASGRGRVRVSRPNGPDCPPECRTLSVAFDGGRLVPG